MEKNWPPDGYYHYSDALVAELASGLFSNGTPVFSLKELDQSEPMFDYLANHSPHLEKISLRLSDNDSFVKCCKFK